MALGPTVLLLVAFVVSVHAQVPYERLLKAESDPQNWMTYAGSYKSHRYSVLDQINRKNVASLKLAWAYQIQRAGIVETSPLVVDGVMYLTEPPSTVTALDVRSGRPLWTYSPKFRRRHRHRIAASESGRRDSRQSRLCRDRARSPDCARLEVGHGSLGHHGRRQQVRLLPDARAARARREDRRRRLGCGDRHPRLHRRVQRQNGQARMAHVHTIPAPGEPGNETWGKGDSWQTGGGSTWLTGSYDPELNLLYWAIGNPAPDWNRGQSSGRQPLHRLCARARSLHWQDQVALPVHAERHARLGLERDRSILFEAQIGGRGRKLLAQANRNGFYYVLDRATGEFLTGMPFAKQTWADGLDAKGRPIRKKGIAPILEGTLVFRNIGGAANWSARAIALGRSCSIRRRARWARSTSRERPVQAGTAFTGGGGRHVQGDDASGAIRALEATTGKMKWEFPLLSAGYTSLLSTAGGLVFGGSEEGNFFALDAETGKPLWDTQIGGAVRGIPMSYAVDGKQYIAIAAGFTLFVFSL